uniref:Uncharacterized protein n=1 Tax=Anguilla anguilla TaxID=7936 RepID=A0A0E9XLB7_ANGAN
MSLIKAKKTKSKIFLNAPL